MLSLLFGVSNSPGTGPLRSEGYDRESSLWRGKVLFERQFFRCIVLAETGHKNIHNLTFVLHYFVVLREFQIYIFFWSDWTGSSNSTEHYWNFKNKHFLSLTYLKLWSDPLFLRNSHCDYWGMLSCKVKLPLWKNARELVVFYGSIKKNLPVLL